MKEQEQGSTESSLLILIVFPPGEKRASTSDFNRIDSIPSVDPVPRLTTQGFDTSESIALSSMEGFVGITPKLQKLPESIQRVPQLVWIILLQVRLLSLFVYKIAVEKLNTLTLLNQINSFKNSVLFWQ